jgi:hypothetical protein
MRRRSLASLPIVLLFALVLAGLASGSSPNLRGVVVGLAYAPPCYPDEPCDHPARPVLGFARAGSVTRVRIGSTGRFSATLEPGIYRVRLLPAQAGNVVRPVLVRVSAAGVSRITVRISSTRSVAASGPVNAKTAGIRGTVIRSPITPVCRQGVPCSAPAGGVVLVFARGGHEVARTTSLRNGSFTTVLSPGTYVVRGARRSSIGGLRPRIVAVRAGAFTIVRLTIDTGIR